MIAKNYCKFQYIKHTIDYYG